MSGELPSLPAHTETTNDAAQTAPPHQRLLRRATRLVRRLVVKLTVLEAIFTIWIWGGPLLSGGLLLAWPPRAHPVEHHHSLTPVHGGHVATSVGVYVREDDDLVLTKGVLFALRRTYMSGDRATRQFGIGTSSNADWYIAGDSDRFQWAAVVSPTAAVFVSGGRRAGPRT